VDILVATPGRLLDLMNQKHVNLSEVSIFVLDEADRMLDMGFIHDIRRVIAHVPAKRQTLLFSATMPKEIRSLADKLLHQPVSVKVEAKNIEADTVNQALYHIDRFSKPALLTHLLSGPAMTRALVFCRTKHGADKLGHRLKTAGVSVAVIHANKSQNERVRTLADFKKGVVRVLVASDIAARGLDVDDISHVVNYDLPQDSETYVHRIGRTGRAGASGQAISFCCYEQRQELRDIERLLGKEIPVLPHSIQGPSEQDYYQSQDLPRDSFSRRQHGGSQHGGSRQHGGAKQGAAEATTPAPAAKKAPSWAGKRPRFRTRRVVK
jgi:ATP-dependent RNA helicase RhlE